MDPTVVTWVLVGLGVITMGTPAYIYLVFPLKPHSQKSRDLMLGAGKDWRDETHFDLNLGFAWVDLLFVFPLFVAGSVGVLLSEAWGYVHLGAAATISLYINLVSLPHRAWPRPSPRHIGPQRPPIPCDTNMGMLTTAAAGAWSSTGSIEPRDRTRRSAGQDGDIDTDWASAGEGSEGLRLETQTGAGGHPDS